jgi:hypothetical protein
LPQAAAFLAVSGSWRRPNAVSLCVQAACQEIVAHRLRALLESFWLYFPAPMPAVADDVDLL